MQFLGFQMLIKRIKAIRFMMADKSVPKRKKGTYRFRYNILVSAHRSDTANTFPDSLGG